MGLSLRLSTFAAFLAAAALLLAAEAASAASTSPPRPASLSVLRIPSGGADEAEAEAEAAEPEATEASEATEAIDETDGVVTDEDDPSTTPARSTAALLACDTALTRHRRSARARLSGWKSRAGRGLLVERFGKEAAALLKRTMDAYDRDTSIAAGLSSETASYRLSVRSKLRNGIEGSIGEIFDSQVASIRRKTLKSFDRALLRATRSAERTSDNAHDERAIARRSALFSFDAALGDLEVPSLGLTKSRALTEMEGALNDALVAFEDSPSAKLRTVERVQRTAAKERSPSERSVDAKIDLVAMIRPDGFGNLQGFVGYQTPWGSQVTVGVQNDADSPEVIGQFGGVRPPFIRVQPKLKLDIEL